MPPRLSIVIVALNEAGNLDRSLQAIRRLRCSPEDYEVIVVDGGSTDSTAELARQAGARVVVAEGKNIPTSRNIGWRNARAPVIAFIDADCLVHPEWLNRGLKHFEAVKGTHLLTSSGGASPLPPPASPSLDLLVGSPAGLPEHPTWVQRLWADHWRLKAMLAAPRQARGGPEPLDVARGPEHVEGQGRRAAERGAGSQTYRILTTRNLFTTRRVIEAVGGFDEELNTGEDYYFCYSAHARGFPVKCDFEVSVAHIGEPASLGEFFQEQVWHASNVASARLVKEGAWGGLNARTFGIYLLASLLALAAGVVLGLAGSGWTLALLGSALFFGAPVALAVRTAVRAGRWSRVPGYLLLYLAYGLARFATLWPGLWVTRKRSKKPG